MKKSDMDFIRKFAAASSAALVLSGCSTGEKCLYGPLPDTHEACEIANQDSAVPEEQNNTKDTTNTQDSVLSIPAQPRSSGRISVLYGPPPR